MRFTNSSSHGFSRIPLFAGLLGTSLLFGLAGNSALAAGPSDIDRKVEGLLGQMTLDEKIAQMTQVDMAALKDKSHLAKYGFGSMLSGGGSDPANNLPKTWLDAVHEYQELTLKSRLKIPLIYGVDAVHGHNNIDGAVVFPHNIGLGAAHNPALVRKASEVTAQEIAATGINWAFAPCVAVAQNVRWGRSYESFGTSPELVGQLGAAAVEGLQARLPGGARILACTKHFAGDGGTKDGIDQGNTICDEATFRKLFVAPYLPAIKAGSGSIMVSYNSWNGEKLHGHKKLLTDVLKGELGFKGFLISDWAAIDQISPDYKAAVEKSINAGMDMAMIPNSPDQKNSYEDYMRFLKELVNEGRVPQSRIDDAVRRILRVKFEFGIFEHPFAAPELMGSLGSAAHRKVARQCVRESLVLLKNEGKSLPLTKATKKLVIVGKAADDLGIQCGGWTIDWQGKTGKVTSGGTTILKALQQAAPKHMAVAFSPDGSQLQGAETVLVVIGEQPYAEMKGDRTDLSLPAEDVALVQKARQSGSRVVTVLLSGRPMILGDVLKFSDALVAAWLPGTEGQGVADVLLGAFKPKGKLPRSWPANNQQLDGSGTPLFSAGYSLTY